MSLLWVKQLKTFGVFVTLVSTSSRRHCPSYYYHAYVCSTNRGGCIHIFIEVIISVGVTSRAVGSNHNVLKASFTPPSLAT